MPTTIVGVGTPPRPSRKRPALVCSPVPFVAAKRPRTPVRTAPSTPRTIGVSPCHRRSPMFGSSPAALRQPVRQRCPAVRRLADDLSSDDEPSVAPRAVADAVAAAPAMSASLSDTAAALGVSPAEVASAAGPVAYAVYRTPVTALTVSAPDQPPVSICLSDGAMLVGGRRVDAVRYSRELATPRVMCRLTELGCEFAVPLPIVPSEHVSCLGQIMGVAAAAAVPCTGFPSAVKGGVVVEGGRVQLVLA
eukprot:TRINITY_DN30574_c0_g1_i1.p1 TRINITY_DN30574_c0_g1~~TRINITY_DN30574_c0_g1_i1.p1  ORF type:complete len:249 (+),score=65.07 TRINITY_DN30574_c0_g1_i1:59-805(+)